MPLSPPSEFPFPFPPYDIQLHFMKHLFQTLEERKFGIFESPTGTGKSLSLICGAITWFHQRERETKKELAEKMERINRELGEIEDSDDWIAAASKKKDKEEEKLKAKTELESLKEKEERMEDLRRRRKSVKRSKVQKEEDEFEELFKDLSEVREAVKRELAAKGQERFDQQDEEIIVEDYDSDGEEEEGKRKYGYGEEEEEEEDFSLRIYYCSRTHSQLAQFVREIQKSPFSDDIRLVSLASRNNMCINESVKSLGSNSLVNEKCLDMQKKGSKAKTAEEEDDGKKKKRAAKGSGSCPYKKEGAINLVRDQALLMVSDIEELVESGKRLKGCPYYASRHGVSDAQIVVLPYNTLLHKPTREAVGIKLKNSVVIVDEAHNLLDTIAHIHSVEMTGEQLCRTRSQLQQYMKRYMSRLKAKNLLYIKQILFVLSGFIKVLGGKAGSDPSQGVKGESRLINPEVLMQESDIFNINLFKLIRYIQKSKISQKLHGFVEKYQDGVVVQPKPEKGVSAFLKSLENKPDSKVAEVKEEPKKARKVSSPILVVLEFLEALTNFSAEARILLNCQSTLGPSSMKYCLLDPATQFTDLVSQCRSIVVAGGTMQPISEFQQQLFLNAGAAADRVTHFSCGHVVPKENLLPVVVAAGPTGRPLEFTYQSRDSAQTMQELYRVLSNTVNLVPGGMVVFLPSYDYEKRVHAFLKDNGLLEKLEARKRIFREPKRSDEMDSVLKEYSRAAKKKGAILFSVVGGKMSEGINFSDDLGRCVVMVGLPFPNARSLELQIINERAALVKSTTDLKELEKKINCGQIEEVILQAELELDLARKLLETRAWEPLVEEPRPNQWKWPM